MSKDLAFFLIVFGAGMATWAFSAQILAFIKSKFSTVEADVEAKLSPAKPATPAAPTQAAAPTPPATK